ncbi:hypothetical protein [Kitasatospora sp. NPDC091207]|uniref:hypothetical protein n=1 Tax=Kitasatospora sp. NPDC091207 TaxID=3364083 RepID=UPI00382C6D6F
MLDAIAASTTAALEAPVHRVCSGPCEPGPEQTIHAVTAPGDLVLVIGADQAARLGPRLLFHLSTPGTPIPQQL